MPWYHLWFVYMILALYLLVPIIRVFLKSASLKQIQYFILLTLVASAIEYWNAFFPTLNFSLNGMGGYVGYFVLGYYLRKYDCSVRLRRVVYLLAVFSIIWMVVLNWIKEVPPHTYPCYTSPFVTVLAVAVFLVFKTNCCIRTNNRIAKLSNLVFGIYLVHDLFIQIVSNTVPQEWCSTAVIFVPSATIAVFICSTLASFVMSKIPVAGKYFV